jgi:glutamine amidotransferase
MTMVGIVDLGMCNLRSVRNAVTAMGYDSCLVKKPGQLEDCSHCILPGVGSFRTAMEQMHALGLEQSIKDFAVSGRPLLGICLGMQLLATFGEEGGATQGLDLIPGKVMRFTPEAVRRIPHVGWNSVHSKMPHPVLDIIKSNVDFYFTHSYHFCVVTDDTALGKTDIDQCRFTSIVGKNNILGLQFHPEKSQLNGLKLIERFCEWEGA